MQLIWLLSIPFILLLSWQAWHRQNKQLLAMRLIAVIVAITSILFIAFPPTFNQAISPSSAVLLTDGYDTDILDSLLNKSDTKLNIYTYETEHKRAESISSLYSLQHKQPGLQTLHILGYGIDKEKLSELQNIQIKPHLSVLPPGIKYLYWTKEIHLGEQVTVAGTFRPNSNTEVKLYLEAAGRLQDSVILKTGQDRQFLLSYKPKVDGKQLYTLLQKQNGVTDTLGNIPVLVTPIQQLAILLLASSPNFEFKFLKNHLGELQHKVASRTSISKGIVQTEWLNMPQTNLSSITPKLLQKFDLVLTEPTALGELSVRERESLQAAVLDHGLGVLTITPALTNSKSTSFFTNFQTKKLTQKESRNSKVSWNNSSPTEISTSSFVLSSKASVTPLITESSTNFLAGFKQAGWGKVGLSLIPQTFPWKLEGQDETYASYWAHLITELAKPKLKDQYWAINNSQIIQPHKPVSLTLTDLSADITELQSPIASVSTLNDSKNVNLPLAQQQFQTEKYTGTFWPNQSGWHQVKTREGEPYYFYVHDPKSWHFAELINKKRATEEFIVRQQGSAKKTTAAYEKEPVSALWFFILFVLSTGFLWLEEKL